MNKLLQIFMGIWLISAIFAQNPMDSGGESLFIEDAPFEFNQSTKQAFYFVHMANIIYIATGDSLELNSDDWIGVFCNDVCVGGQQWDGAWTEVPAMGFDEFSWTEGYCQTGDYPTFQFYDTSEEEYYPAFPTEINPAFGGEYTGWENNTFFNMELLYTDIDCNGDPFGPAFLDDCGQCVGDGTDENTIIINPPEGWEGDCHFYDNGSGECQENWAMDCGGVCFGEADWDECGICCGGSTEQECSYFVDETDFGGVYDCNGDCSGSADFDECGQCCDGETGQDCSYFVDEADFGGVYDCNGECSGDALFDDCGICAGGDTGLFINDVEDCEGPDLDCNCECCYGTPEDVSGCGASEDDCDVCSGGNTGHLPESDMDCNGDCFGDAFIDNCEDCVGGNTGELECDDDCAGVYGGDAFWDDCDECVGGNTGILENWAMDCNEDCFGSAFEDDCGVCSSGNTDHEPDSDIDCNGDCAFNTPVSCEGENCGEAFFDNCDICSEGTTGHDADSDMDDCGICFGENISDDDGFVNGPDSDCAGDCFGEAFIDECDECSEGTSGHEANSDKDACGFCFGDNISDGEGFVTGPDADCAGVCFGNAFSDECEVCSGGTTGHIADTDKDACGLCFGGNISDDEGFVTGPNADCTGYCFGEAFLDDCEVCSGGYSEHEANSDIDCEGSCFGEAIIDYCNVCTGGTTGIEYNTDLDDCNVCFGENFEIEDGFVVGPEADCAGVCFGEAFFDDCNECSEGTTGHESNSDKDVCGVCFGENFEASEDFIVGPEADCTGLCFGEAFFDECGECSEGTTGHTANIAQDCNGTCYGDSEYDHCEICAGGETGIDPGSDDFGCGCFELPPTLFYFDADGDGLGYGESLEFCPNNVDPDWVDNNEDPEPFCNTNNTDDCDVCAGENADQDCLGVCFGEAIHDECGICDGDNSSCNSPIAYNQDVSTFEDDILIFDLNVSDPTNDPLTIEITINPGNGDIEMNGITATYTPEENFVGIDNFYYIAFDGLFYSEPVAVEITVIEVNDNPESISIDITTLEDEGVAVTLVGTDIESDEMIFEITDYPDYGELSDILRALGIVEYTPNENYNGLDEFSYRVTDGELYSEVSIVTMEITPVNDPPFVTPEWYTTPEETPLTFSIDFGDIDGDDVELQIIDGPFNGELIFSESELIYTPYLNYIGQDEIILQALETSTEDSLTSNPAGITIVITEVNDAPVAYDAGYLVNEDSGIEIELIGTDPENHSLSFSIIDNPINGDVTGDPPFVIYTPSANFDGVDSFTYNIEDELFLSSNSATITFSINPINDSPSATNTDFTAVDPIGFDFDLSPFIDDIDNVDLEIEFLPESEEGDGAAFLGGTITFLRDYTFRYENSDPQEYDYILYKVKDDVSESNTQVISFEIPSGREVSERSTTTAVTQDVFVTEEIATTVSMIGFDIIAPFPLNGDGVNYIITEFPVYGEYDTSGIIIDISQDQGIEGAVANFSSSFIGTGIGVGRNLTAEDEFSYQVFNPTSSEWSNTGTVNITIFGVNDPPEITSISDVEMDEDTDLIIPIEIYDPDSWILDEYIDFSSTDSENFIFYVDTQSDTISSADLLVIPVEDFFGTANITILVTDGEIASPVTEEFTVTVNPVNDPPVMVPVSNLLIAEEEVASLILNANDVDGNENLTFNAEILDNPGLLEIEILDSLLTITPNENLYGTAVISVNVSDQLAFSNSIEFEVNIHNINDPPIWDIIPVPASVEEDDGSIIFSFTPEDVDGDELQVQFINLNPDLIPESNIVIIPQSAPSGTERTVHILPGENQYGEGSIILILTDGNSPPINQQINFSVSPVNDAPNIVNPGAISFKEDKTTSITLQANDIEGNSIEFSIVGGENIQAELIDNIVEFIAAENYFGIEEFTITASDGLDENSLIITVEVTPENDPPEITSVAPEFAIEDEEYIYEIIVADVDNDEFYFSLTNQPNDMEISNDGIITWIPRDGFLNTDIITLTVADGEGEENLMDLDYFSVIVIQVNDPPVIVSTAPFTAIEDVEYSYQVEVDDPDDLEFIYNLENEPVGMNINTTGLITWTASEGIISSGMVTLNVTDRVDDEALTDEQQFEITVTPVNDSPVIISTPTITAIEDIEYTYQLSVFDPDDNEFTFTLVDFPESMFISETGLINWTAVEGILSSEIVHVSVSDGGEDGVVPVIQEFEIIVTPVNDGPVIQVIAPENLTAIEDIEWSYQLIVDDPDDFEFNYYIFNIPEGMVITDDGLITWTPTEGILTSGEVIIQVNDGGEDLAAPANQSIEVIVTPVNDPPVIVSIPSSSAVEEIEYTYQVQVADPDDSDFSFSLVSAPDGMAISVSGLISWTPAEGILTSDSVTVSVEDGGEDNVNPALQTFIINVTPVNDPPVVENIPVELLVATEDILWTYQVLVEDPDDSVFTFTIFDEPDGMDVSDSGLISWLPIEGILTSDLVTMEIADGLENEVEPVFLEFEIIVTPVNDPPVILEIAPENLTAIEDIEWTYQIMVEDPDDDEWNFILLSGPESMVLSNSGFISWTPAGNDGLVEDWELTSGLINIEAADGGEDDVFADTIQFEIIVDAVNDVPEIISEHIPTAETGIEWNYLVELQDPDDEIFYYELHDEPANMIVNPSGSTGLISWTPVFVENTTVNFMLHVYDGPEDEIEFRRVARDSIDIEVTVVFMAQQSYVLLDYFNLISFYGLPYDGDYSIENVLSDLGILAVDILSEGIAATRAPITGEWVGSIADAGIDIKKGYWININIPPGEFVTFTTPLSYPLDPNLEYNLHIGKNLISYLGIDSSGISYAIPDDVEPYFQNIFGTDLNGLSAAASNLNNCDEYEGDDYCQWVGSLANEGLFRKKGYWIEIAADAPEEIIFSWVVDPPPARWEFVQNTYPSEQLSFYQSTEQAFYFIENVTINGEELAVGDWIISYCGDKIVGSREWTGIYTDVPAMGDDSFENTSEYCQVGEIPKFKVYIVNTGELIDMTAESIQPWGTNEVFFINSLTNMVTLPESFSLGMPYPNPFNPVTTIQFGLPFTHHVSLKIYDLRGRMVSVLMNAELTAGYHTIHWNAVNTATGVYFVKMTAGQFTQTQKVVLLK